MKKMESAENCSNTLLEKKIKLAQKFAEERTRWKNRVVDMSKRIKYIDELADLQVEAYSARQELVEYFHYLTSLIAQKNAEIIKDKRRLFEYYTTGYDYKLDKEQKNMYIQIDLEDKILILKELENHLKFIDSTISTVDNIIFGIKHRITIEEYKKRL